MRPVGRTADGPVAMSVLVVTAVEEFIADHGFVGCEDGCGGADRG